MARIAALAFVFTWFFAGGLGHFLATDFFVAIVPPYVPFPREIVLATGACEIAGALALWPRRLRRLAGLALIAYAICVTPVHVDMLVHAARHDASEILLWLRLVFQPVLIWLIWAATQSRRQ
ncbi:MAG: hypothetical protein AB7P07_05305 [Hyphomonadaceae bacterium]